MGRDNRRIAVPDNCVSPNTFKEHNPKEHLIDNKGKRADKRACKESRLLTLRVGIVPSVTGSAYLEFGNTKIVCSVNGPRSINVKSEITQKGQIAVEFKYALFSCKERQPYMPSNEEVRISKQIQDALEPVILLHKFPKSRLDITIYVLENDGGVITSAITCAGAALSNAGIQMYDLPIGCSLVSHDSQLLVDPTYEEELYSDANVKCAKIGMAMMLEYKNQVIFMDSQGSIDRNVMIQVTKVLHTSCTEVLYAVRHSLKEQVEESCGQNATQQGSQDKFALCFNLLQPQKYMGIFLQNNIRPDARKLNDFRPILINVDPIETALSSALVKLGNTSVLCGIKAELTNPDASAPEKGFFIPNVTLTSLCSNKIIPGPPTEQAQFLTQLIMDLWKDSTFLEPGNLMIEPGKLCWCVFAEMICLSDDGNVLDACILALMAALKKTKLPEVMVDADADKIKVTENGKSLKLNNPVFSVTCAVFDDIVVLDPTSEEESLTKNFVHVFLLNNGSTNVHSMGIVKEEQLFQCVDCAKERFNEIKSMFETCN